MWNLIKISEKDVKDCPHCSRTLLSELDHKLSVHILNDNMSRALTVFSSRIIIPKNIAAPAILHFAGSFVGDNGSIIISVLKIQHHCGRSVCSLTTAKNRHPKTKCSFYHSFRNFSTLRKLSRLASSHSFGYFFSAGSICFSANLA